MIRPRQTRTWIAVALGGAALGGTALAALRSDRPGLPELPPSRVTLRAVAQRLGRTNNPHEVTALALRTDRVLGALTRSERDALGRNAIRFRADRPVVVEVAVDQRCTTPFWIADQGFRRATVIHAIDGRPWTLFARRFEAGPIGLGVNALDRSQDSHYAVFVRGVDAESGPTTTRPLLEPIGPDALTVRPAGRDVSPFADTDEPFADLPDATARGVVVRTRREDRADGALLPFGRAWKTRQPSGPRPDQVVVSFGDDSARSLAVSWRTDPSVRASAARFVAEPDPSPTGSVAGEVRLETTGTVEPIESDGLLNDPIIHRHKVRAENLRPDTRYRYAVGDGTAEGWSSWYATRTAPEAGRSRDFRFLYLGDAQCELERWGDLAHAARRACPDAGFLLLAGDLVDRGNERSNWDHFFLRAEGVFDAIPFLPAVGNHEYLDKGPRIYRGTFDLPRNGPPMVASNLVYSFEYGDAFVAVLDSNQAIYDARAAEAQGLWLDRALAATKAAWKFVTFHHPIYASHPSRSNPQLGRAWVPIFDRHGVDLVLTGHDHAYLRTVPLRAGAPVTEPGRGTTYVVSVSGEKFYGQGPQANLARGFTQVATYQTIAVEPAAGRLHYRSWDRDGHEVDAFDIQKPPSDRPPATAGPVARAE